MNTTNDTSPFDCPDCGRSDMLVNRADGTITCPGCRCQYRFVTITAAGQEQVRRAD
ncbi:MAG: hypothetical protein GYA24_24455 [Candidatus Lokiarchaeota archaeon]|nr:hypothetical protein [Candidatus Lokiarchaeota archaeon]